jgi:putative nucleotidyltransferase with HDIG domain
VLLVVYTREVDLRYIGVIIPLLLVLYFTFKTSMDRVADANKHVEQVDRLYLSTIETLAMAIDAKDQVTHGHIRRVQRYAVGLARHLGVQDESLIKAIEAAALLHDMGKLAVPEHILNKPGKLTPAEFERMKLHASIGADILSSIAFPYPVVPIVRHHHECWNGSGYPDGIKGTDIPIGARILAVVDCFDALTSHRPYRRRLSDQEAIQILWDRSGSMYDPIVVEAFSKVYEFIERELVSSPVDDEPSRILQGTFQRAHDASKNPQRNRASASYGADDKVSASVVSDLLRGYLQLTHADVGVVFRYVPETDEIVALHAAGPLDSVLLGLRIQVGQRLSGWVAANRQAIINSDAALDLVELAPLAEPPLRSCLSVPLESEGALTGVVSLYSVNESSFSSSHLLALANASAQFAQLLLDSTHAPIPVSQVS